MYDILLHLISRWIWPLLLSLFKGNVNLMEDGEEMEWGRNGMGKKWNGEEMEWGRNGIGKKLNEKEREGGN
jgi:hypothetical protein